MHVLNMGWCGVSTVKGHTKQIFNRIFKQTYTWFAHFIKFYVHFCNILRLFTDLKLATTWCHVNNLGWLFLEREYVCHNAFTLFNRFFFTKSFFYYNDYYFSQSCTHSNFIGPLIGNKCLLNYDCFLSNVLVLNLFIWYVPQYGKSFKYVNLICTTTR